MTDNRIIAIIAICSFVSFSIGWFIRGAEPKRTIEPNETGVTGL